MKWIFSDLAVLITFTTALTSCLKGNYDAGSETPPSDADTYFAGATSAENISGTMVQVSWKLPLDQTISEYNVYSVNADSSFRLIGTTASTTNLFVHPGLSPGRLQKYVVRAVHKDGKMDTNRVVVTALTYAGVTSNTVINETTVDLTFPSAADAANLRIYCAMGTNGTMTLKNQVAATITTLRLTDLTAGTFYSCKVKAVLPDGSEDNNSLTTSFIPQPITNMNRFGFSGLTSAINTNGTSVQVSWGPANPSAGTTIAGFRIFYQTEGEPLRFFDVAANKTTQLLSGLNTGMNYSFAVRAIDTSDYTDGNQIWKTAFTYNGITSGGANGETTAVIYFPAASNAISLHIYCFKTSEGLGALTASIASTQTQHSLSTLTPGTEYSCSVKAVGAAGEDGNSRVVTFTTQGSAP